MYARQAGESFRQGSIDCGALHEDRPAEGGVGAAAKANRQGITDLSLSAAARLPAKPRPAAEQIMILTEVDTRSIDHVVGLLRPDRRLLFNTGAGLSADSGLPTYRGVGGLYGDDRPTRHGYAIEEALSGPMMRRRPEVTREFPLRLDRACGGAIRNRTHRPLAGRGAAGAADE